MKSNEILSADLLDILFEGRNKAYGAYDLRRTYNKRITLAIAGTMTIALLVCVSQLIAGNNDKSRAVIPVTDVIVDPYKDKDVKKPEKVEIKPPAAKPQVKTIQYVAPLIVKDDLVKEVVPEVTEITNAKIDVATLAGTDETDLISPPIEKTGTGAELTVKQPEEDYDKVFKKVEVEASFPGGLKAWKAYLERNLNGNVPTDEGAAPGLYKVLVQFVVDKEGNISDVQATDVPKACPGCGPEAVRVIRKGGKWTPAIQNGRPVKYQAIQSISFMVVE